MLPHWVHWNPQRLAFSFKSCCTLRWISAVCAALACIFCKESGPLKLLMPRGTTTWPMSSRLPPYLAAMLRIPSRRCALVITAVRHLPHSRVAVSLFEEPKRLLKNPISLLCLRIEIITESASLCIVLYSALLCRASTLPWASTRLIPQVLTRFATVRTCGCREGFRARRARRC
jgi:hypothetical protein